MNSHIDSVNSRINERKHVCIPAEPRPMAIRGPTLLRRPRGEAKCSSILALLRHNHSHQRTGLQFDIRAASAKRPSFCWCRQHETASQETQRDSISIILLVAHKDTPGVVSSSKWYTLCTWKASQRGRQSAGHAYNSSRPVAAAGGVLPGRRFAAYWAMSVRIGNLAPRNIAVPI